MNPSATNLAKLNRSMRRAALVLGGAILTVLIFIGADGVLAVPPDHHDDALRKMCEHGLAASAAEYCRMQFHQNIEKPPLRARWAMRQMECRAQAALREKDADEAWKAVVAVEDEYRREFPEDPRLPWLAWQLARADLLRSQQALAKWLAAPAAGGQRDAALQAVRRVQEQIDQIEREIKARLPLSEPRGAATRNPANPTQAPSTELLELSVDCTLLRCESLLVRARSYPKGSPDRIAAASDVDRVAGEMLRRAPQDWPARDEMLVAKASAGLEIGKKAESLKVLIGIVNESPVEGALVGDASGQQKMLPSSGARIRAGTVAIEALCAGQDLSTAEKVLSVLTSNFTGAEVDLSAMRVELARVDGLPADRRSEQLKRVIELARLLGDRYGGYWRNRGEALLAGAAAVSSSPEKMAGNDPSLAQDLVSVEVRQLLAGGDTTAAIARLKAAAENALAAGQRQQAVDFAMQAAVLLQKEKKWIQAADVLAPSAASAAEIGKAPAAHALAAWCLAQELKARSSGSQLLTVSPETVALEQRYELVLKRQLELWPSAKESVAVEEYLSNWYARKKRFEDLVRMWLDRAIALESPEAQGSASEAQSRALQQWLDALLGKLPLTKLAEQQAHLIAALRADKLKSCQRGATVAALAASMLSTSMNQSEAESLTGLKMPGHSAEESSAEQALVAGLLCLSSARRGDAASCRSSMQLLEFDQLTATVHLAWARSFVSAMDELDDRQITGWRDIAGRLPAWSETVTADLSPAMKMVRLRLDAIAADGPARMALHQSIGELAETYKNDPHLQLSWAASLVQSDGKNFEEAIRTLKRVATSTTKESDTYLRARWLEIRWRLARGETKEAQQIAALTLSSQALKSPWWKARFQSAARQP